MTFLGKILVFLNVMLATALLSWSMSLYTNRVDWQTVEADGKKLTEWPTLLSKETANNNALYADAKDLVTLAETQLLDRQRTLSLKLQQARAGQFFELEKQGIRLGQSPNDRLDLNSTRITTVTHKDGQPVPLLGLEVLQKSLQTAVDDTLKRANELSVIRKQLVELDVEVTAFNNSINRYRVAIVQREDEYRYLDDNRVNWDAQLITLQKRNDQLVDRLKAFGVNRPVLSSVSPAVVPTVAGAGSR